jgi:DHA1 family putative efflux transporter-like MFS transporter
LAIGAFLAGTAELVIVGIVELVAIDLHTTLGMSGLLVTVFSIAFAVGSPIVIAITAKVDRKKMILATLIFSIIGNIIALVSEHILPMMISRIVLGVSAGVFTVIAFTMAANLSAHGKRGSAIGNVHVGFSGSLVIGVPLGIFIARNWGWESIFGILAILNTFILLLMIWLLPRMPSRENATLRSQVRIMKQSKILVGLAITFLCVFGYSVCYTYLTPYLQKIAHLDLVSVSWVLLLMGICGTLGSRLGGYGTDKWGVNKLLLAVLSIHAFVLLLSPLFVTSLTGTIIMIIVWGLSAWATVPAIQYYLISLVPDSASIAVSINTSVFQFGIALGAAAGGIFVERNAIIHIGWVGGIIVLLSLLVAIFSLSRQSKGSDLEISSIN